MTIHTLLAEAAEKVGAIGKNATMTAGGTYKYRKVDDVIQAVHPVFADLGIVMVPQVVDHTYSTFQTKSGADWRHCILEVAFYFHGPDGDAVEVRTIGEATDSGDKCANKAHTAALKVALCQLLLIPFDSQDPDDTPSTESEAAPSRQSRPSRSEKPAEAPPAATDAKVCALCDKPIAQGEAMTKKRGKFQHVSCASEDLKTEKAATDAVAEAFEGAQLVDALGNPVTDEPF